MESESWDVESGIHLKDSTILLTIRIRDPSSTDNGIRNPRLSWITRLNDPQGYVTRDGLQRRFLAQQSVTTLLRHRFERLQHCSNI